MFKRLMLYENVKSSLEQLTILLILITSIQLGFGQTFTLIPTDIIGVNYSSVNWVDYDNDGDLDIFITGSTDSWHGPGVTKIYQNNNGIFNEVSVGLNIGIWESSTEWGDYDNDVALDILFTGKAGSSFLWGIYHNDNGNFSFGGRLPNILYGSASWGDYDNDGDLDILLAGWDVSNSEPNTYITKIYCNDNGNFNDISAGLTGVKYAGVAWGDYDNDGDLDIIISGSSNTSPYGDITLIYRNDNGNFTNINAGLRGGPQKLDNSLGVNSGLI